MNSPVLLAACGNEMAGDDGVGPAVLRAVRGLIPPEVEVVDLGTAPATLLELLEDRRGLVLVDAAAIPDSNGEVLDVDCSRPERLPICGREGTSTHGLGIGTQLQLAGALGLLPELARLIAIPVRQMELGSGPSVDVAAQVNRAAERAAKWCREYVRIVQGGVSG